MLKTQWSTYSRAKGGQTKGGQTTTGNQETNRTLETNSEVFRGIQRTRETGDNFAMIFAMIDQEMEATEITSQKD